MTNVFKVVPKNTGKTDDAIKEILAEFSALADTYEAVCVGLVLVYRNPEDTVDNYGYGLYATDNNSLKMLGSVEILKDAILRQTKEARG